MIAATLALLPVTFPVDAQPPVTPIAERTVEAERNGEPASHGEADEVSNLRFSFEAAPWRSVLRWLADESGLALHVGAVPPGSFTYSDSNAYTPDEAIERINLFLIPEDFTLVRSGRLVSVISLEDPRSVQQLEAMAELISVDELSERGRHDVVRCLFPLDGISPNLAVQELSGVNLMTEPVIMPQSEQLLITETAGKLLGVAKLLSGIEPPQDDEEVVQRFEFQHQSVDDVLDIVRPHLGLQGDELVGLGLSISLGRDDQSIFVTGSQETIDMLDSLVELVDVPGDTPQHAERAELQSHTVTGNNLEAVYEVLQALLAGESIRLSMEQDSNSIVAYAPPEIHQTIAGTIEEMQAPSLGFEVVELNAVDPYFAISLLNEMFGVSTWEDELEEPSDDAPRIDADPANQRLFVRGKPSQIEQVQSMIKKLETDGDRAGETDGGFRVLSLPSEQAEQVLETAERFWDGDSQVIVVPGSDDAPTDAIERTFHSETPAPKKKKASRRSRLESAGETERQPEAVDAARLPVGEPLSFPEATTLRSLISRSAEDGAAADEAAAAADSGQPLIKAQATPQGILIQSDDEAALKRFEDHVRQIAGSARDGGSPPVVFYLKYAMANNATRMLADLLDGALSQTDSSSGALVQGFVAGPQSGLLGSFLNDREEATTMTAGSATVVSDARLNRLIVQGTVADIEQIESYLKIIDKDESMTAIETHGQSQIIELLHTDAEEVAEVIRNTYPGRIAEASGTTGGEGRENRGGRSDRGGGQRDRESRSDDSNEGRRDGQRQPEPPKPTRSQEPVLAVAVHPQSNSLVVTAPEPLLAEVEQLARSIDDRSEQDVQVIAPGNPEAVRTVLEGILSGHSNGSNGNTESRRSSRDQQGRSNRRSSSNGRSS